MTTKSKKPHVADAASLALIPLAKEFTAVILKGGKQVKTTCPRSARHASRRRA